MMTLALFGLSAVMSLLSAGVMAALYVWPWLRTLDRERALIALVVPHMFFRFIGLSFLIPGVVSPTLPAAFALPAGYGDFVAGVMAIIVVVGLTTQASWAIPAVLLFNIWGVADLLFALFQGLHLQIDPGALGATFFIPTAIVPPLLVTHALIFGVLVRAGVPSTNRRVA